MLLTVFTSVAFSADKAPTKKQTPLQTAYNKQRVLYSKYRVVQQKVYKDATLLKLRKTWTEANDALNKKIDSLSVKERKAEKAALDTLNAAITRKITSSKEIAGLEEKRQSLQKQKRDLQFQIGLTSVHLYHSDSPLQQTLDADSNLKLLRKAMWTGTRKERSAAYNKYNTDRRAKLKTLKEAKPLFAKIEDLKKQIAQSDKDGYQAMRTIFDVKRKIQYSKDKSLQPLRDKLTAARNTTRKVSSHAAAKTLRAAANKANLAYRKKYSALASASKELTDLQKQLDAAYKEIRNLRPKKKPIRKNRK
jgi:hypothetical protein